MPARPNFYYNNPALKQIGDNLSAAIFGAPELDAIRLENQRKQMVNDQLYEAKLERGRREGFADEFLRRWQESQQPQIDPSVAGENADFRELTGTDNPFLVNENAGPKNVLDAVQADPEMMRLAVKSGMMDLSGIQRGEEARLLREMQGSQRMDQIAAQGDNRLLLAEQNNTARAQIAATNSAARMQMLSQAHTNKMTELAYAQNDPNKVAKIQAEIALIEQQMGLVQARTGLVEAQTDLTGAKTATERAGGASGGKGFNITAKDYTETLKVVRKMATSKGQQLTPEAEQMAVNMALQARNKTGFPDLGNALTGPQFQQTTEDGFWPWSDPTTQIDVAPQGGGMQVPPAAPAPQAAAPVGELPPQVAAALKENVITTFGNGQQWTKKNGQPTRVK